MVQNGKTLTLKYASIVDKVPLNIIPVTVGKEFNVKIFLSLIVSIDYSSAKLEFTIAHWLTFYGLEIRKPILICCFLFHCTLMAKLAYSLKYGHIP